MLRLSATLLALVGMVAFPWPLAASFVMIAALFAPPLALVAGVVADVLYYVPGAFPVPLFTLLGLLGFIVAQFVHGFVKARIIT